MKINHTPRLVTYFSALIFTIPLILFFGSSANAAEYCSNRYYVDETLSNGARWDMCWEHRQREGIVLHHIFYTPKDKPRRMVLNHAAVAQIHVPYDDNGARYHDISDYGIGGDNMASLGADECPAGNLLTFSGKNVLCKQIETRDIAHKSGNNSSKGSNLSLFSVSPVGAYYYIPTWRFFDDGSIEPWIGATGALQRFGGNQSRGWKLGDGRIGISHLHNFFWKLDFDLDDTPLNDAVEEINFPLVNGKRQRTITEFNTEASRKVNPDTMRRWRVRDKILKNSNNHSASYDIVLGETGHQDIGPASEPFTHNDFYVTKQKNQEKFASHNPNGGKNLAEFTNGESLTNNDIVIWAGVTFYHMPRSEDAPHMDAHWSHLQIIPRDWHDSNPLITAPVNTPPTITSPTDQQSQNGDTVNLNIEANDIDGDTLSYSASGLPTGLQINSASGLITGTLTSAGDFTANVVVNDGTDSSTVQFGWVVSAAANNPPQLTTPTNQSGQVGDNINLTIEASDADGDSLTYSATGLPPGLQTNSTTGVISGSLDTAGNYTINLSVSDHSDNTTAQFSWSVAAVSGTLSNEVSTTAITVNGLINDWNGMTFFATDPDDISGTNNQIDWLKVAIAHSPQNVYMLYQNRLNIDPNNNSGSFIPWGWQAFLDTDNDPTTGFVTGSIGADYVINGNVIERYIGTGTSWSWDIAGRAQTQYVGSNLEMSFPRALIGSPQSMRVIFTGDNAAFNGDSTDTYPDSGYLSYTFSGAVTPNTAPVADDQQISVGSGASISVLLTASDIDNDPLTYELTQQPAHGTVSGSIPNLAYTSDSGFTGSDSFRFTVSDGVVDSQVATISVTVTPGQNNGAISNFVNSPISINGNASDWDGLSRFADDGNDASGNIDWNNTAIAHDSLNMYLLYNNWENIDPDSNSGSYLAWGWQTFIDADKNSSTGYKTGAIGADYIIEGNQIHSYSGSGTNWSWLHLGAIETQYVNNTGELLIPRSMIGNPASIRVVFSGDSASYSGSAVDLYPDGQNNSQASTQYFDYDFSGHSGSSNRPVAFSQTVSTNSGSSVEISLLASDLNNNSLSFSILSDPQHGTLTGTAPNLTYTPNDNFIGQDSFDFNVNDGTSDSATVTVNINVTGLQNGVYSNAVSSINIDGNIEEWGNVAAFDEDGDDIGGSDNTIDWKQAAIAHNGSKLYFMYKNHNAINRDVNSGTFINWGWQTYIDIDGNDATGYKIGTLGAEYLLEGTQLQKYTGDGRNWSWNNFGEATVSYNANTAELGFDRDLIGNPAKIRVAFIGDNEAYGGTSIDTYPNTLDFFEYKLSGGSQNSSNRPVSAAQTISVLRENSQTLSLTATDADNDTLSFRIISQPLHGTISGFNSTGTNFSYQPETGFEGTDSFRFVANDGTHDSSVRTVILNVSADSSPGNSGGGTLDITWLLFLIFIAIVHTRQQQEKLLNIIHLGEFPR